MRMVERAEKYREDMVELRRALHREPEIGLALPLTKAKVLAALEGLPLEITEGRGLGSVTAVLRGGRPGGAVLLRGDMDALPVTEDTGLEYASRFSGAMHGCGHDLHVAGLVGAARLLCEMRDELPGDVVFMFQPGEEGHDGARMMIEEGVLNAAGRPLDAAYAVHVAANLLPAGVWVTKPDVVMSASDVLRVTVRGEGGHGSSPHKGKDPVPAACEMVLALQSHVTRTYDIFDPVVVTVGRLTAGTQQNVLAHEAEFEATVRSYSPANQERLREALPALVRGIAAAHGLEADAEYRVLYPVTVNDAAEAAFAMDTVHDLFGEAAGFVSPIPAAGSEDFSLVLREVPGAMLMLGATPADADPDSAPANHSPQARYDDSVLPAQAALLAELAVRRLSRGDA
ncbi:M20 family metallopeptidase [Nocardiopsis sp. CC223A]|uniref:M20 metallopeptidase family protein n=1 Tax=Nocardiopsis sp. CC223A TaxID=3044051 RepID=UPI00278C4A9B|nr:M20 family metallopeptidase [Nocardiopsis sp. CC223A]